MLLRGRNLLAYRRFPPNVVVRAFVAEAVDGGHRRDPDLRRAQRHRRDARRDRRRARDPGAGRGRALLHRATCSDPARAHLHARLLPAASPSALVAAGVHVLAIKDMAGLLRAPAARTLVEALRARFDAPVHLHTHDTAGGSLATYLAAVEAGVDAVDGAAAPLAGMTSQPSLSAIVAALAGSERGPRRSRSTRRSRSSPTGRRCARSTPPTRPGCAAPTGRVYRHQIPGGQLSNLRQQADGDRRRRPLRGGRGGLRARQRAARQHHQGHPDQQGRRRPRDLRRVRRASTSTSSNATRAASTCPDSRARLPPRRARPARPTGCRSRSPTRALSGRAQPAPEPPLDDEAHAALADRPGASAPGRARADHVPRPARGLPGRARAPRRRLAAARPARSSTACARTRRCPSTSRPGVRVIFELEAIGEPDENGMRTVMTRVNGQLRPLDVRDRTIDAAPNEIERADPRTRGTSRRRSSAP